MTRHQSASAGAGWRELSTAQVAAVLALGLALLSNARSAYSVHVAEHGSVAPWVWAGVVALTAVLTIAVLARRTSDDEVAIERHYAVRIFAALGLLALLVFGARQSLALATGLLAVGPTAGLGCVVRRGQGVGFALWCALAFAVAGYTRHPDLPEFGLLLAVAASSGWGLTAEHRSRTVERIRRNRAIASESRTASKAPAAYHARAALCAVIATLTMLTLVAAGRFRMGAASREARDELGASRPSASDRGGARNWMGSLGLGSGTFEQTQTVLATVRLRNPRTEAPIADGRLLYFPVAAYDSIGERRLERGAGQQLAHLVDGSDGSEDGWIELRGPDEDAELVAADVRLAGGLTGRRGVTPLPRLEPLLALRLPEVGRFLDGELHAYVDGEVLDYTLVAQAEEVRVARDFTGEAVRRDSRYTELPPESAALERLRREAQRLTRDAKTDAERVFAVVDFLRDGFEYSLDGTGVEGLDGLVALLDRRSGYCASYAAAAVVMLRTLGIPTRAVAGLLGKEFDSDRGEYVLRSRHGHAWFEAQFRGLGWVRFDPTPSGAGSPTAAGESDGDPLGSWGSSFVGDVRAWLGGRDSGFDGSSRIAARLREAPRAMAASARQAQPLGLALIAVLAVASVALLARLFAHGFARARHSRSAAGRSSAYEQRLILALSRLGASSAPSLTLAEIAHSARARLDSGLGRRVEVAVRGLYSVRFGGEDLAADLRRELDDVLTELKSAARGG